MKIEQRGFGITEVSERVAGIDGQDGEARIVFADPGDDTESFSTWLRPEDVKALIEALTAAYGLMAGDTPTPAPSSAADSLPDSVTDRAGDVWYRIGGTHRYTVDGNGRTLEYIEQTWGLRRD